MKRTTVLIAILSLIVSLFSCETEPSVVYTLSYQLDGQTMMGESEQVDLGQRVMVKNIDGSLIPEGSEFAGWSLSDRGTVAYKAGEFLTPGDDTTLYAVFELKSYKVCYYSDAENLISESIISYGFSIDLSMPDVPEGQVFRGWYTDPGLTQKWDFTTDRVRGELKLYASFDCDMLTVVFQLESDSMYLNYEVAYGSLLTRPQDPVKEGCRFLGWINMSLDFSKWDFETDVVKNSMMLCADWEQIN